MVAPTATPNTIQSVDRAIRLLLLVASSSEPLTGVEVAARAGVNRSTAWKLLATLEEHGLLDRDGANRYVAGVRILELAASTPWTSVALRARPILEILSRATGEAAVVSVVTANGITGAAQVDGVGALGVRWVGELLALTSTSPGKLLLASLPDDAVDAILRDPVSALTERTMTDPDDVRRELAEVRRRGIATSLGEHELGVNGISAPISRSGHLIATVSVTGPDVRLGAARISEIEPLVREAAARLQAALESYSCPTGDGS